MCMVFNHMGSNGGSCYEADVLLGRILSSINIFPLLSSLSKASLSHRGGGVERAGGGCASAK